MLLSERYSPLLHWEEAQNLSGLNPIKRVLMCFSNPSPNMDARCLSFPEIKTDKTFLWIITFNFRIHGLWFGFVYYYNIWWGNSSLIDWLIFANALPGMWWMEGGAKHCKHHKMVIVRREGHMMSTNKDVPSKDPVYSLGRPKSRPFLPPCQDL